MKKKVKKIPKYYDGSLAVAMPDMSDFKIQHKLGVASPNSNNLNFNAGQIGNTIGGAADLIGMATSGQKATVGTALGGAAKGAMTGMQFGPIGAGVGAAVGLIAGTAGSKNSVNENSTSTSVADIAEEGSGWMKWFGMSEEEMMAKANRIANANISEQMTEQIRSKYAMNPNNPNGGTILAAEGGIMRKPVDALVSKGELIYDPTTKKLRQVPGSKGKPNKADDVFARLYEGDVVISNSPTMLMANGKTPAQNLMGMVDKYATGGTVKAREAIIKKVVNWQEANKTKPQEYAKFDEGYPGFFKYLMDNRTRPLGAVISEWFGQRGEVAPKFDGFGKLDFLNGIKNVYNTQSDYEAPIKLRDDFNWNQHRSVPIDQLFEFNTNNKTTSNVPQETKLTPEQIAESLRIADIGERHWLRGSVSEPNQSLASLAQTTPEKLKIQKLAAPSSPRTYVDNDSTDFNTNWGDLAYKAASIFTPLFDREKAESVQYQVPVAKYRPTSVNIDPQRRAIDEGYAMARYNQANISPNTGAGMAYGLQAATNRAKQLSDVYSWQTNTQNNLIGQNVDTYNKWSTDYANIMNNVYDKAAANRATARNINRQNRATALKNWGQIRRDDKAYEMDRMKLQMLDPMLQYGYENYDNYLKWKKENGYG